MPELDLALLIQQLPQNVRDHLFGKKLEKRYEELVAEFGLSREQCQKLNPLIWQVYGKELPLPNFLLEIEKRLELGKEDSQKLGVQIIGFDFLQAADYLGVDAPRYLLGIVDDPKAPRSVKAGAREGLENYLAAILDIGAKKGVRLDPSTGEAALYSDKARNIAEHIMMAGGDVSAFGFDPETGNARADLPALERSVHLLSFAQAMKGKNAGKTLGGIEANQVFDPETGELSIVGETILANIDGSALATAAKEAAESGDPEQIDLVRALLEYIETEGSEATAPANIRELRRFTTAPGNRFGGFR